jgi:hypothetical protein
LEEAGNVPSRGDEEVKLSEEMAEQKLSEEAVELKTCSGVAS